MGVQNDSPNKYVCPKVICEGSVERSKPGLSKLDIVIGKSWKRLYMVLSTDGLRFYKSKFHYINGKDEKEVIPICHIKSTQAFNPDSNQRIKVDFTKDYFQVETQRDVVVVLRTNKEKVSWPALIQIELIKYKNKQDIARYKSMFRNVNYNVKKEIENTECTCFDSDNSISKSSKNFYVTNNKTCNCSSKNKPKCIVLPRTTTNDGNGFGVSVKKNNHGKVVIDKIFKDTPAYLHEGIKEEDEILTVNAIPVASVEEFDKHIKNLNTVRLGLRNK